MCVGMHAWVKQKAENGREKHHKGERDEWRNEGGIKWGKYLQRGVREEECHMKGEGEEKQENALWEPISVLLPAPPTLKLVVLDLYPFFF